MPKHPDFRGDQWAMGGLLALMLAGCATAPPTSTTTAQVRLSPALQQIATRLPGEYVSVRQEDRPVQSLRIKRRSGSEPDNVAFSLIQTGAGGANERNYGLGLQATKLENRLDGRFALLNPQGQARRSCPMDFHITDRGLVGETDPASCRFGEGAEVVGLLKEIAFDGRSIRIGDRLVEADSGEARGEDQVIQFFPARQFSGWLGAREGEEWRIARDFRLRPGAGVEPLDAADMSLGVLIDLNYYRMERGSDDILLRLTVTDVESGKTIAESWAEPDSRRIGVALPDLQVGLSIASQ